MGQKHRSPRKQKANAAKDSPDSRSTNWRPGIHWVGGGVCGVVVAGVMAWSLPRQPPSSGLTPIPGESDAWVMLEARNRDGSFAVPPAVLKSNEDLRFHTRDPSQPEEVRINIGFKPNPVLFVNLKAYPVERIVQSEAGGLRKARVWVELPLSRAFEREWFMYMRGLPLSISDATPSGALQPAIRLHVEDVLFTRKWTLQAVDLASNPERLESFVAVVTAEESFVQWFVRHWVQLIENVWTWFALPIFAVLAPKMVLEWRRSRKIRSRHG